MQPQYSPKNNPRVIIIQKLYGKFFNTALQTKIDNGVIRGAATASLNIVKAVSSWINTILSSLSLYLIDDSVGTGAGTKACTTEKGVDQTESYSRVDLKN